MSHSPDPLPPPGAADHETHGRRLARLGSLVGGFAHEIKNPLSTIGLNLRLMEEELTEPLTPREKRILARTRRLAKEVERLQRILNAFLGYVRPPAPELARVSLNELVREVADLVGPGLRQHGIHLKLLLTEGLAAATIDRGLVHQALLNLLRNAEEAMVEAGRTGEIIVGTAYDERPDGAWHVLSVTDAGPGIPPDVQARCFHPYFSTKRGGTGLGLAITRRFVEDHGGEIRFDTQAGIGTRFEIRLPDRPLPADEEIAP